MKQQKNKYVELWEKLLPDIIVMLKEADHEPQFKQLNDKIFTKAGSRHDTGYSFNLEFQGTTVANNIDNSAVARDLKSILLEDTEAKKILQAGNYSIDMNYYLTIQKL
jgi:plasmid maintenance system killer protein